MTSPFSSSWAKVARGDEHLYALKWELAPLFGRDAYNVTIYREVIREGPVCITYFTVGDFPRVPSRVGVLVGDVICNYRAALDHMVWQLVRQRGDLPTTEKARRQIQFPMAKRASIFDNDVCRWFPGVPTCFTDIIKRYQPYRRAYPNKAIRLLHRLVNSDKHRVIVPMVTGAADYELEVTLSGCSILDQAVFLTTTRALNRGMPIAHFVTRDDDLSLRDGEVDADGYFQAHPSFGRGYDVERSLSFISETVSRVIDEVEGHL